MQPSLQLKGFIAGLKVGDPNKLQRPPLGGVLGALSTTMLSHSAVRIVSVAGVISAVGTPKDIDIEGHAMNVAQR